MNQYELEAARDRAAAAKDEAAAARDKAAAAKDEAAAAKDNAAAAKDRAAAAREELNACRIRRQTEYARYKQVHGHSPTREILDAAVDSTACSTTVKTDSVEF